MAESGGGAQGQTPPVRSPFLTFLKRPAILIVVIGAFGAVGWGVMKQMGGTNPSLQRELLHKHANDGALRDQRERNKLIFDKLFQDVKRPDGTDDKNKS